MRAFLVLLLVSGVLVTGAGAGTAVGNPTGLTIDTAPTTGLAYTSAVAEVRAVLVTDRRGDTWTVDVDGPVDLLGGTRLELPLAEAARLRVIFAGPLELEGDGPEDRGFSLTLELPELELTLVPMSRAVPEVILRLGAPDWAATVARGLDGSRFDESIDEEHALHDALVTALAGDAAIYGDDNADGRCTAGEAPWDEDDLGDDDWDDSDDSDDDDSDDDSDDEAAAGECDGVPLGSVPR